MQSDVSENDFSSDHSEYQVQDSFMENEEVDMSSILETSVISDIPGNLSISGISGLSSSLESTGYSHDHFTRSSRNIAHPPVSPSKLGRRKYK